MVPSVIKSYIRKIIKEDIIPNNSDDIESKYKKIYKGMLKGDKKKLMKYIDPKTNRPNPDAMAMGRAVNLVKKDNETESVNENSYVRVSKPRFVKDKNNPNFLNEERTSTVSKSRAKSELKQMLKGKRDDGMGKSTLKSVLAIDKNGKETKIKKLEDFSKFKKGTKFALKETNMNLNRLTEFIKTALKGPIKEGYYGSSEIEKTIRSIGYDSIDYFFEDNPGATEALMSWIENIPEFREKLDSNSLKGIFEDYEGDVPKQEKTEFERTCSALINHIKDIQAKIKSGELETNITDNVWGDYIKSLTMAKDAPKAINDTVKSITPSKENIEEQHSKIAEAVFKKLRR